jgi:hypothetical protein
VRGVSDVFLVVSEVVVSFGVKKLSVVFIETDLLVLSLLLSPSTKELKEVIKAL